MTIATKNGVPIIKDGAIASNCVCCGDWYCFSQTCLSRIATVRARISQSPPVRDSEVAGGNPWFAGVLLGDSLQNGFAAFAATEAEARIEFARLFNSFSASPIPFPDFRYSSYGTRTTPFGDWVNLSTNATSGPCVPCSYGATVSGTTPGGRTYTFDWQVTLDVCQNPCEFSIATASVPVILQETRTLPDIGPNDFDVIGPNFLGVPGLWSGVRSTFPQDSGGRCEGAFGGAFSYRNASGGVPSGHQVIAASLSPSIVITYQPQTTFSRSVTADLAVPNSYQPWGPPTATGGAAQCAAAAVQLSRQFTLEIEITTI